MAEGKWWDKNNFLSLRRKNVVCSCSGALFLLSHTQTLTPTHLACTNMVSWGKRPASLSVISLSMFKSSRFGKLAISSNLSRGNPLRAAYLTNACNIPVKQLQLEWNSSVDSQDQICYGAPWGAEAPLLLLHLLYATIESLKCFQGFGKQTAQTKECLYWLKGLIR